MICPVCGNQINDNAKFCPVCGNSVGVAQPVAQIYQQQPQFQPPQPPKKNKTGIIIAIIAIILVVAVGVGFGLARSGALDNILNKDNDTSMSDSKDKKKDKDDKKKAATEEEQTNKPSEVAPSNPVDKPKLNGDKLVVAISADYPPYEYKDSGELKGIDIEIARAIANELNMDVEFVDMQFEAVVDSVANGKCDIAISGLMATEDRMKKVDFTESYYSEQNVIVLPKDSAIGDIDCEEEYTIGVIKDTVADSIVYWDFENSSVTRYASVNDVLQAVDVGRIDFAIVSYEYWDAISEFENLKINYPAYCSDDYTIAIAKDNDELKEQINVAIEKLKANGTITRIVLDYCY